MIADRSAGLDIGDEVPLGTRSHKFVVVGLIENEYHSASQSPHNDVRRLRQAAE
jgi:hypothetical protein